MPGWCDGKSSPAGVTGSQSETMLQLELVLVSDQRYKYCGEKEGLGQRNQPMLQYDDFI